MRMIVLSLLLALPVLAQPSIFLEVINNTTTWPKIWASDGMPSTPAVPSPAMAGLAVPNPGQVNPGQVDAIRLPSGKALVFGIRQHNTLSVLEVTGTLPVVTFKICATIQLSLPYRVTRATLASPDGKMLYVMAGHYLPAGGPPQNDVMWTIPILDCVTKCLDDTAVKMYTIPTKNDLGSMAFDPGGKWIAAAGVTNNIEILDAANPSNVFCTVPLPPKGAQARGRNIVAVSPNTSGGDRAVYVGSYEPKSGS